MLTLAFYLSSWYKRYELASRFAIYYTATAVSGAFSGLLAGLITQHLDGHRGLQGWQWLFVRGPHNFRPDHADIQLIEGVASSFLGFFTWMILPDWPSTTKWLSEEEQILAAQRLAYDGLASTQGASGKTGHWEACKQCFTDWKVWILVVMVSLRRHPVAGLIPSTCFAPVPKQFSTLSLRSLELVSGSTYARPRLTLQSAGRATSVNTTLSRCTPVPLSSS